MRALRRLVALSRPRFWLYLAGPVLVGLAYGADAPATLVSSTAVALFAYFLVPANVYLYGINDVFDAEIDRANPKKDGREVRFEGSRLVVAAVVAAGLLGIALLAIVPPTAVPWLVGFFVLGAFYSAPPRLKTKPPLDSLSNGLYVLPGVATYAALSGTSPPILAVVGGWLWTMAMHTYSAVVDLEPDRRTGIRTTATVLGERGTLAYCAGCWLLAATSFGLLDLRAGLLLGVYPALLAGIVGGDVDLARAYWWFPAINAAVGTVLTMAGLWRLVYG